MKKLLVIFFICSAVPSFARHITGGEIFYEYLGPGAAAGTSQYKITLRLFRDCFSSGAQLDPTVNIGIFDKLSGTPVSGSPFTVSLDHIQTIQKSGNIPCIINPPQVCYQVGFYYFTVTLPNNQMGYWISFQRCCRVDNITNLSVAIGVGATYVGSIAGSHTLGNMTSNHNSSPQFYLRDTALVCQNRNFTLDFSASDPDGDLLTYEFCEAYTGGSEGSPVVTNPPPPPYAPVPYGNGYSASAPMGPAVTINPTTGIISGIAPAAGSYVITVCINEWRNGNVINTHRKDFILKARRIRKIFGGGMRQAGYLAAAGIYALDNNIERLAEDHVHAKLLGEAIAKKDFTGEMLPVKTNIVIFEVKGRFVPKELAAILKEKGVLSIAISPTQVRFVTHLDVSKTMIEEAIHIIEQV